MSCSIKSKTITYLQDKGAINRTREVIDLSQFEYYNDYLTKMYYQKYDVGNGQEKLFKTENKHVSLADGRKRFLVRAIPNEYLFEQAELFNNEESDTFDNLQKDLKTNVLNDNKLEVSPNKDFTSFLEKDEMINFVLFNNQQEYKNEFSAVEVLDNIINNFNGLSKYSDEFIQKAKILSHTTKAKVKILDNPDYFNRKGAIMTYFNKQNQINLDLNILEEASLDYVIESFLHEVVHSVTVHSLKNPVTFEQKMFKDFITDSFNYYKQQMPDSTEYGFTNEVEFVAEIFTNPIFADKIKDIPSSVSSSKTFLQSFIDFIRSIFGLPKISKDKEISYNAVIDAIVAISPKNIPDGLLYKVQDKVFNKEQQGKKSVKNIDEKLVNTIENITVNIKEALEKSEFFLQRTKDENIQKRLSSYIDKTKTVLNEIENYAYVNQVKSITTFLNFMNGNIASIEHRINNMPQDPSREEITNLAELYDNYLKTFSVIDNVKETIASLRSENREDLISNSDLNILEGELVTMAGKYNYLNKRVVDLKKKALKFILNDIKWFPEVEKRHYNRLAKEHKDSKIIEDKESWIIDKMQNRDAELIQEDLENTISEFLENPLNDIMASSMVMNSPINISSPLIQIANQMLTSLNNDRINEELKKDKEFKDLFNQLVKEKGTNNINKLYKNIIQYDSNGKPYIVSEYNPKFYTDVHQKILGVQNEYSEKLRDIALKRTKAEQKFGRNSKEWKDLNIEYIKVKNEKNKAVEDIQKNNVIKDGKKLRPSNKWKNNIKLTPTEEKVRDFFIDIIETSKANTFGVDPLITFSYGVQFYELPKITKSDKERALKGDIKNIAGDKWKDLTQLRSDDVDYVERYVDQNNEVIKKLKIHYRDKHNFDNKDQSLDLMNIFRLEYKNTNRYKHRKKYESELNFLLDIAENKTYYQREGTKLVFKKNTKKLNEVKGKGSNTYKMLSNMLESRFYDINKKHNLNLGGVDVNKAISFINKGSSALALSLNFASGTANVVNANAQLFLESFIKGRFIKAKSIAKANKIYTTNIDKTVTDNINPINKSFVNKINEYFNIHGNINFTNADFLRSDMLKKGFSRQTLQVFQDSGEHWIQSVITMSVLDSIKVLNKNGKFINKKGEVTTEPKAASLLDMLKDNKEADILEVDEKVVYTTHSRLTEWNKGGKDKIDMLITKKIYDSVGNYRDIDQPEIMRHWYGPLLFLFRRYLIPMGVSRLRGMAYSFKDRDELTEAQTKFSYALQEYEEGTYTTLMRYMFKKFKDMNYYLMSLNKPEKASISTNAWASLSDYEKHNIKRAVTELVMTWGILPLAVQFVAAAADDADSEYLFFLAYQLRRLDTELSQYRSIEESFKVMRSPIPSARLIETTGSILLQVLSPWQWHTLDDVYKGGYNKGENKLKTKVIKQIPVLKEFKRTYEDLYDFQNSTFGTGL